MNIVVDAISHLFKLVSNQTIDAIPMHGITKPPGTLNVFLETSISWLLTLNLMVAKITNR